MSCKPRSKAAQTDPSKADIDDGSLESKLQTVFSLTNSLTNSTSFRSPIRSPIYISYHIRSQISHLTVLKFAHQFAPSSVRRLNSKSNRNMPNRRLATKMPALTSTCTSQSSTQTLILTSSRPHRTMRCQVVLGWVASTDAPF